ncbi:putative nuclease HARBI1 [Astyanax mexicanus]|uniref:Putative nuclease HARBI1 n=1 Tax=Astyanax mexicanus TaxID=7994 RepID=A0A8T2M0K0_ASTMX|nr:putative nuclease HARBI1 [Astyanax mexicanus]
MSTPILQEYFGEGELKKDFRLSRESVNTLVHTLEGQHDHGWGKALEVGIFLYWLASATSYRVVSEAFDVPQTTVYDVVHRTAECIMAVFKRVVLFPSPEELEAIGAGFCRLAGSPAFHHVVGSIDGSHIRIKPPGEFKEDYFNRKLFYSIQLQAICDHSGRFLNVFSGVPGSVHDARVLKLSSVYVQQLYPPPGWCILGDGGYPCLSSPICLMTPFREPVQNPALEVKFTFAPVVVSCCAFLHNLCLSNGDIVESAEGEPEEEPGEAEAEEHTSAAQPGDGLRDRLAAAVSAPGAAISALREHDY